MKTDTTTIKINRKTKQRLDHLREYKRETYEEVIEKMLNVLNACKINPLKARARLAKIDSRRKENIQSMRGED